MLSWVPRPVSNGLRERLFGKEVNETPSLGVSLAWCWVVPVLAALLWMDLGQMRLQQSGVLGEVLSGRGLLLMTSNRWPVSVAQIEHSLLNQLPQRTFASTKMTVFPSTNPPLALVMQTNEYW